jgi:Family of unknown function (DUF6292)
MADSTAPQLDPEDVNAFVYYAGHYATAVAKHLIAEGVVPTGIDVDTPHMVRDLLSEGEAWVFPPRELAERLSPIADATLAWDEISGWSARVYLDDTNCAKRWLGHGLVPAPERVAVFLTAIQVDFDSAGSEERPHYRTAGSPYDDVFDRLAPYAPPEESPRPWQNAYTNARNEHYEVRFLTQLTAEPPGAHVNVPLLSGELAALHTLLEWAETPARDRQRRCPPRPAQAARCAPSRRRRRGPRRRCGAGPCPARPDREREGAPAQARPGLAPPQVTPAPENPPSAPPPYLDRGADRRWVFRRQWPYCWLFR